MNLGTWAARHGAPPRRELIDLEIDRNRGRIVKTTRDGVLVEFDTANDAVHCAIDVQSGIQRREPASLKIVCVFVHSYIRTFITM